jgi:linalool 8-monooxygenase
MTSTAPGLHLDLADPDLYLDHMPHELFARLRREDPVYWNAQADGPGFWAVTRHGDIVDISRQPELFSSAHENGGHRIFNENEVGLTGAGDSAIGVPFISRDPPSHGEYRKFVLPALTPNRLEGIEARVSARCARLLDETPLDETIDIVPHLSAPLPLLTLADLLGLSFDLWPKLYEWTNAFVGEDDPDFRRSPEAMAATLAEFFAFARELFDLRRAEPGGDLASLLANARIDGEPIPFGEFVGNLILVLVGGNETTRNSLSHTLAALAAHPEQWAWLREDPDRLKIAVREMVRHASPVLHMRRTATADTRIGGRRIARGDKVVLWYVSGNRDEAVFAEPDRFDLSRPSVPHVGFGTGQHVCVGWRLAELQLRVAFHQLSRRVRRIEQVGQPRRIRSNFINGLKNLDLRLVPS